MLLNIPSYVIEKGLIYEKRNALFNLYMFDLG